MDPNGRGLTLARASHLSWVAPLLAAACLAGAVFVDDLALFFGGLALAVLLCLAGAVLGLLGLRRRPRAGALAGLGLSLLVGGGLILLAAWITDGFALTLQVR